jgi:hypothetical protein
LAAGCGVPQSQIVGVWMQPDEHLVASAPCADRCRIYQAYEVIWEVKYPQNLKLTNLRLDCRNIGSGYPCALDSEINIDNDLLAHKATIYWRNQGTAVAVRLIADEVQ